MDNRKQRRSNDDRSRGISNLNKRSGDKHEERHQKRDTTKVRGGLSSSDLSKVRRQILKHEALEANRCTVKRNRSNSPHLKKRLHLNEKESSKRHAHQNKARVSGIGCPTSKLLPWPQFKSPSTVKSVPFETSLTLRQDAFGLHPDINPVLPNVVPQLRSMSR